MTRTMQKLVQRISPGSTLLHTWTMEGGMSAAMTGMQIAMQDGEVRRFILRQPHVGPQPCRSHAASEEFHLLQALRRQGLAVPTPVFLDVSCEIASSPYLVIEYIDGRPEFAPASLEDYLRQMAEYLAKIHHFDLSQNDLSFLRIQDACPEIIQGIAKREEQALETAWIRAALEQGALHQAGEYQPHRPVLLHGDYWPGNILWNAGRLIAVVDWEDARLGNPLSDLAISRLDIATMFSLEAMHTFTEHYLSQIQLDGKELPYWDLCAALRLARLVGEDLRGWADFFHPYGRQDICAETIQQSFYRFSYQALKQLKS